MKEIGRYDTDIQMFVESPKPINMERLLFQRWLVDNGKGEHRPVSKPAGELALAIAIALPDATKRQSLVSYDMNYERT